MQIKSVMYCHYISIKKISTVKSKQWEMTTTNAGKDTELLELSYVAGRKQNGPASLEDSLAVSYQSKDTSTTWPSSSTPMCLPKRSINFHSTNITCPWMFMATYSKIAPKCI